MCEGDGARCGKVVGARCGEVMGARCGRGDGS